MSRVHKRAERSEKTFKFDAEFIKLEAMDALKGYFMPFAGLYAAAIGKKVVLVDDKDVLVREGSVLERRKRT